MTTVTPRGPDNIVVQSPLSQIPPSVLDYDVDEISSASPAFYFGLPTAENGYFVPSTAPNRSVSDAIQTYVDTDEVLRTRYNTLIELYERASEQRNAADAMIAASNSMATKDMEQIHAGELEDSLRNAGTTMVSLNVNMFLDMLNYCEIAQHLHMGHILRAGYNDALGTLYRYRMERANDDEKMYESYVRGGSRNNNVTSAIPSMEICGGKRAPLGQPARTIKDPALKPAKPFARRTASSSSSSHKKGVQSRSTSSVARSVPRVSVKIEAP